MSILAQKVIEDGFALVYTATAKTNFFINITSLGASRCVFYLKRSTEILTIPLEREIVNQVDISGGGFVSVSYSIDASDSVWVETQGKAVVNLNGEVIE